MNEVQFICERTGDALMYGGVCSLPTVPMVGDTVIGLTYGGTRCVTRRILDITTRRWLVYMGGG